MKIAYKDISFRKSSLAIIAQAEAICAEYARQGYDLTLRQLFYQFVARGYLPNKQTEYKRLGDIINDARLAGQLDWTYIVDRTRNVRDLAHWDNPEQIIGAVAAQYRTERWARQPRRVEVWIEKDALLGVILPTCETLDVPAFSCRGYTSQSEMWGAAQRHLRNERRGQRTIVIHLGDHDPSGIDMTRDIQDRLAMFGTNTVVRRIALTMDQVREFDPPPNPAKFTDSRAEGYIEEFHDPDIDEPGTARSWELDALPPDVLAGLITSAVEEVRDDDLWDEATEEMEADRVHLRGVRDNWTTVTGWLDHYEPDREGNGQAEPGEGNDDDDDRD